MRRYVKRYPLVAFFVVAIGLKWAAEVVDSLSGIHPGAIFLGWTPSIAGLVVAWAVSGTPGLRQLLDQALTWRAPLRWYLVVFVGFPGLVFCIYVLTAFVTDAAFSPEFLGVRYIVSMFVSIVVVISGEELFGWRGFALPRMLDRWSDLTASVLLGVGWWLWHRYPSSWLNIPLADHGVFFVGVLGFAIVMTWVYRNTGSALLAGVGLHVATYFSQFYMTSGETPLPYVNYYLMTVLALIVVAVYGTKRFSRDSPESSEKNPSPANSQ